MVVVVVVLVAVVVVAPGKGVSCQRVVHMGQFEWGTGYLSPTEPGRSSDLGHFLSRISSVPLR